MNKTTKRSSKQSSCKHIQSILRQLQKELAHQKNCTDLETLKLPSGNSPTFEIFSIPNLEIIPLKTQGQASGTSNKKENNDSYINCIEEINNNNTMLISTDGSAINNPGPTGAGEVIKKIEKQLHLQELATKESFKQLSSAQNTSKKICQTALKIYISL